MRQTLDAQLWNVFPTSPNVQAESLVLLENSSVSPITAVSRQLLNADLHQAVVLQLELPAVEPLLLFAQVECVLIPSAAAHQLLVPEEEFSKTKTAAPLN